MIKARLESTFGPVMLIGLSRANCERLLKGEPILFDAAQIGFPSMLVAVVAGETEDEIAKTWAGGAASDALART